MTEIADIFNEHGQEYIENYGLSYEQLKVLSASTSKLGGHANVCEDCGHLRISYNSCRNRHCPKCQGLLKEKWIEDRKKIYYPFNIIILFLPYQII